MKFIGEIKETGTITEKDEVYIMYRKTVISLSEYISI